MSSDKPKKYKQNKPNKEFTEDDVNGRYDQFINDLSLKNETSDDAIMASMNGKAISDIYITIYSFFAIYNRNLYGKVYNLVLLHNTIDYNWNLVPTYRKINGNQRDEIREMIGGNISFEQFAEFCKVCGEMLGAKRYICGIQSQEKDLPKNIDQFAYNIPPNVIDLSILDLGSIFVTQILLDAIAAKHPSIAVLSLRNRKFLSVTAFPNLQYVHETYFDSASFPTTNVSILQPGIRSVDFDSVPYQYVPTILFNGGYPTTCLKVLNLGISGGQEDVQLAKINVAKYASQLGITFSSLDIHPSVYNSVRVAGDSVKNPYTENVKSINDDVIIINNKKYIYQSK